MHCGKNIALIKMNMFCLNVVHLGGFTFHQFANGQIHYLTPLSIIVKLLISFRWPPRRAFKIKIVQKMGDVLESCVNAA